MASLPQLLAFAVISIAAIGSSAACDDSNPANSLAVVGPATMQRVGNHAIKIDRLPTAEKLNSINEQIIAYKLFSGHPRTALLFGFIDLFRFDTNFGKKTEFYDNRIVFTKLTYEASYEAVTTPLFNPDTIPDEGGLYNLVINITFKKVETPITSENKVQFCLKLWVALHLNLSLVGFRFL
jgi:hypothetical protein